MKIIGIDVPELLKWFLSLSWVAAIISWLQSSSDFSNWLFVVIGFLALLTLIALFVFWRFAFGKDRYVADEIDGNRWTWNYSNDGSICNLTLCCSQCGSELPREGQRKMDWLPDEKRSVERRIVVCSTAQCGKQYSLDSLAPRSLEDAVMREISAKRRYGTWHEAIKINTQKEHEFKKYH